MSAGDDLSSADRGNDSGQSYALEQIEVADAWPLSRTVSGTAIGNFTEWYDFGIYSYVVAVLSSVFFPHSSLAQLATFDGLTVSFLIRPIGGSGLGHSGRPDRAQERARWHRAADGVRNISARRSARLCRDGIAAPILLFATRAIQGFSTGGEYVGAMIFLAEHSPDRHRGHLCSFLPVGTLSGYILGALLVMILQTTLSDSAMASWGWRIPLLVAAPLGIAGLFVRLRLEESPAYDKQFDDHRMDSRSNLRQLKATVVDQWRLRSCTPAVFC